MSYPWKSMFGCSCPSLLSITSCSVPAHLGRGLTPQMVFFQHWSCLDDATSAPKTSQWEHPRVSYFWPGSVLEDDGSGPIKVLLSPDPCREICSNYSVQWPRKISDGTILGVHTSAFHFPGYSRNQLPRPSQESEHHSLYQILFGFIHRKHLRHLSGARQFK